MHHYNTLGSTIRPLSLCFMGTGGGRISWSIMLPSSSKIPRSTHLYLCPYAPKSNKYHVQKIKGEPMMIVIFG